MKRLILAVLFISLLSTTAFSQTEVDSIEVEVDTIHVRGFVFDKFDKPMANVRVSSERFNTRTAKNGFFELKGVDKKSFIYFETDTLSGYLSGNDSRFILYQLAKLNSNLNTHGSGFHISAKRETSKNLIKGKELRVQSFVTFEQMPQYP